MAVKRHQIGITTDAGGNVTTYSEYVPDGTVVAVVVDKGTLAITTDITITGEKSGIAVLTLTDVTANATYSPRGATHSTAGAAALYAAGGSAVLDRIPVAMERIKVVVAQGGAAATGTLHVYVES